MRGLHHRIECRFDRAPGVGQERGHASKGLVGFGVKDMQDGPDQQGMTGLFPVIAPLKTAFGIDQDVGDVLDVADLPFTAPNLEQRIIGRRIRIGRIEQKHPAVPGAKARCELPVLTLDVMDDRRPWPGQERGHHQADAFARPCRRETQDMLRSVVTQIGTIETPEHDAIGIEESRGLDFIGSRPSGGTIGLRVLCLPRSPDRHTNRDGNGDESARRRDHPTRGKDARRIGFIEIPPPEDRGRIIDRPAADPEPWRPELRLKPELPCHVLCCRPCRDEDDQKDGDDLAPENFRRGHGGSFL